MQCLEQMLLKQLHQLLLSTRDTLQVSHEWLGQVVVLGANAQCKSVMCGSGLGLAASPQNVAFDDERANIGRFNR